MVNDSPVGVLCFEDDNGSVDLKKVAMSVVDDGRTWLSSAKFEGRRVLRACVTSHQTQENNLTDLIDALEAARTEHRAEL